jgi:hypothetical protein
MTLYRMGVMREPRFNLMRTTIDICQHDAD